ncbi:MAG: prepilin-type N-terminal cleavage/methylation domain-containing protein [Candidatus Paceibacterota bacterium]
MLNNQTKTADIGHQGFTLIEVITALTIIMVGIIGAFQLVNQSLATSNTTSMQLTAAYLGKEGFEIVRNIRDDNYLKYLFSEGDDGYENLDTAWMNGLASNGSPYSRDCSAGCGADYTMRQLETGWAGQKLKHDGNFFNYTTGSPTLYQRIIKVTPKPSVADTDYLNVSVKVIWSDRGKSRSIEIQENLYNTWPQ